MSQPLLTVQSLCASIGDKEILKGVNISFALGEIHFLLGPNGSGKSTLAYALMGNPAVVVTQGSMKFRGEEISAFAPEERAKRGIYLGFQHPVELGDISMISFFRNIATAYGRAPGNEQDFKSDCEGMLESVGLPSMVLERSVNGGFSGGEKKRNEIAQLQLIKPTLAILDEFDSGLDIDGTRSIARILKDFLNTDRSIIIITHSGKIAEYLKPDYVHIMKEGRIIKTGDSKLIGVVEKEGFGV